MYDIIYHKKCQLRNKQYIYIKIFIEVVSQYLLDNKLSFVKKSKRTGYMENTLCVRLCNLNVKLTLIGQIHEPQADTTVCLFLKLKCKTHPDWPDT